MEMDLIDMTVGNCHLLFEHQSPLQCRSESVSTWSFKRRDSISSSWGGSVIILRRMIYAIGRSNVHCLSENVGIAQLAYWVLSTRIFCLTRFFSGQLTWFQKQCTKTGRCAPQLDSLTPFLLLVPFFLQWTLRWNVLTCSAGDVENVMFVPWSSPMGTRFYSYN